MEENIEVKDVQKTEYLDKNGLDMLWAKVKENTNNQVEVERNRAVAKEDNITNSLSEFASKTTADGQYFRADVHSYDIIGTFSKKHSLGTAWLSDYNGNPRLTIRNPERMNNQTILTADELFITDYSNSQITISPDGVKIPQKTTKDIVTANNSTAHIGLDDDQAEYAYVAPLENGKVPEKYLDLPQIDTTALKALEQKVTANTTAIEGKQDAGNYIPYNKATDVFYYLYNVGIISQGEDGSNKTIQSPAFFEQSDENHSVTIRNGYINISNTQGNIMRLNIDDKDGGIVIYKQLNDSIKESLRILEDGIRLMGGDNNHVLTSNGSTIDITEYAKKTDIPEVDTSDFVNKNADEAQIINSPLAFTSEVVIASDMEDENTDYIALSPTKLQFSENNYTSSIELNGKDTDVNTECSIEINADHGNPLIRLYSGITGNGNDESALEITNSGISISNSQNENIGPDKVFATNGSVADLAQYVKKSEITADGNVNDVQVNGVSVVENKIANIKPSTKESLGVVKVGDGLNVTDGVISVSAGNYLTYDSVVNEQYFISPHKTFIFAGRNNQDSDLSIGNNHIIVSNNNAHMYSKMLDNYIELRADKNALNISCANITGNEYKGDDQTPYQQFVLNKQGVWLYGGDDNHVLTSNASTIDITQYVLKSVYDEKIAALEARIAALEAKHVEV